jgi:hypothetical protein
MQIFLKLYTGKVITYDLKDKKIYITEIIKFIKNNFYYYNDKNISLELYENYDNSMNINKNEIINLNTKLCDLYKNNIVKEIILKVIVNK